MRNLLYVNDSYLGAKLAANADFVIQRDISRDHVLTNDRGWRVARKNEKAGPADAVVMGCSWAMGVGGDYEGSIPAYLEHSLGKRVVNLGVGSYSLFQSVRLLCREISIIKPKLVIMPFGSWLIDRCLKEPESAMSYRPILVKNKEGAIISIAPDNPPEFMARHYKFIAECLSKTKRAVLKSLYKLYLTGLKNFGKLIHLRKRILYNLLGKTMFIRFNPKSGADRSAVLTHCFDMLEKACREYGCRIFIYHLYPYRSYQQRADILETDRVLIQKLVDGHEAMEYVDWRDMKQALDAFSKSKNLSFEAAVEKYINWSDNNHPTPLGYKLIADGIVSNLSNVAITTHECI